MAAIHWTNNAGGNWSVVTNWSSNPNIPGITSDVLIDATPAPYSISINGTYTVDSIAVIAAVTLSTIAGNAFTITDAAAGAASSNAGTIDVVNYSSFTFAGSMANSGTIADLGGGNATDIYVGTAATLTGSGKVTLNDDGNQNAHLLAATSGNKLVNVNNTILGSGSIGDNGLVLDNQAAGIIDASGTNGSLVITNASTITNEGLLEATGTKGLEIRNETIGNTGTLLGSGTGVVYLENSTIAGGTLSGTIQTPGNWFNSVLDGSTNAVTNTGTNTGTVTLDNYSALGLLGAIVNKGTIADIGGGNTTSQYIDGASVTLSGTDAVTLIDNGAENAVITGAGTASLLANINNTISGAGRLGNGQLNFDNRTAGVVDASGGSALIINAGSYSSGSVTLRETFTNEGLLEATNPGMLTTTGGLVIVGTTVDDAGKNNAGRISALGTLTHVDLQNSTIKGGTLTAAAGDIITTDGGHLSNQLDGTTAPVTIAAGSVVELANYSELDLLGSIVNDGTIFDAGSGNATYLVVASATMTLSGGGQVMLNDQANGNAYVQASASGNKLVNVNNTIFGAGTLGLNGLVLDNQAAGIIDANGVNASLTITGASTITNEGLVEATSAEGLLLRSIAIANTGTIQGISGGAVYLEQATIAGGTLAGSIVTANGDFNNVLDGSSNAATSTGTIALTNYSELTLLGTLVNQGTIADNATGNATYLNVGSSTVTLTGGGVIALDSSSNAIIEGAAKTNDLVNAGNTVDGGGQLGAGNLVIDNRAGGVIDGNGTVALVLDTGNQTFTNEGTAEGSSASGLVIQNTTLTNTGVIVAEDGGNVSIATSTTVTNINAGTLTGGTWGAAVTTAGHTATLAVSAGPVSVGAGTIVLSGVGSSVTFGGTAIDSSLTSIGAGGTLEVLNGRVFTAANALSDNGAIVLGGGTLSSTGALSLTGGKLSGNGTVAVAFANAGTVEATGGLLKLAGGATGAGTLIADAGSTLELAAATTAHTVTDNGVVLLDGKTYTFGALSVAATGSVVGAGTIAKAFANTGLVEAKTGTMKLTLGATGTGTLQADAGAILNLGAGSDSAGTLLANGLVQLGGGSLTATTASVASSGHIAGFGTLAGPVANSGLIEATGGTLIVSGGVSGSASILQADSGGTLQIGGAALATITGGVTLNGTGSVIEFGSAAPFTIIESSATAIASNGTLAVLGGRGYVTANTISDAGLLNAGGGTFTIGGLSLASTGAVSGFGTFTKALTGTGTVTATGGLLTLAGGVGGSPALSVAAGSTLELGATSTSGAIRDSGQLKLDGNSYTAASVTVLAGASLVGTGTLATAVTNAGTVEATGGLLKLGAGGSGAGKLLVDAGSTIELAGRTSAGTGTDNGILQLDGKIASFKALTVATGGTLVGTGTLGTAFGNAGTVEAKGGMLTLTLGATGSGTLQADAGGTLNLAAGTDTGGNVSVNGKLLVAGASLTATTLTVGATGAISGSGTLAGPIANAGVLTASGGKLDVTGGVTGSGSFTIVSGATLELGGTTAQGVSYGTGTATLQLDAPSTYSGTIGGLDLGDAIDFSNETVSSALVNGTTLTVTGSAGVTEYQVAGALAGNHFAVQADTHTPSR